MLLDGTAAGTASGTSHTLTGLTPATTYTVGLKAVDASGNAAAYPATATRLKKDVEGADGLLFVTPEYNRSIPGVLKNAIDIASRPWGTNSFAGKPAAVIGTSIGSTGTAMAQQHLRNVLAYLDVPTLAQPEVFIHFRDDLIADDGSIASDGTRKFLQGFVDDYVAWIRRFAR